MKSRLILKIIVSIFSIFFLLFSLYSNINCLKSYIKLFSDDHIKSYAYYDELVKSAIKTIIFYGSTFLCSILFFLIVHFKGLRFVTNSLIVLIKEHRASTAEQRKEKKQAKLAREIAQKQAELEKMNNSPKPE